MNDLVPNTIYKKFLKRIIDFVFAIIALILLFPMLLIIGIICAILYKGTIFFKQDRAGINETTFAIYKFITMRPVNKNIEVSDTLRLTKFGTTLRKYSIDELPQIINILRGDMSWIGPRPLFVSYLPYYREYEKTRHTVKPGITGLAQINGRNALSWDSRLAYDVKYVKNISFRNDCAIFLKTIRLLLTKHNEIVDPRSLMADLNIHRQNEINSFFEQFILRKPELADVPHLLIVKNNKQAASTLEHVNNGYTLKDIENWIVFHNESAYNDVYVIENMMTKQVIGHAGLYDIQKSSAVYGILIGLPEFWNKGIGTVITNRIIDIGINKHQLNTITLNVLTTHETAIKMYTKIGFVPVDTKNNSRLKNNESKIIITMQYNIT